MKTSVLLMNLLLFNLAAYAQVRAISRLRNYFYLNLIFLLTSIQAIYAQNTDILRVSPTFNSIAETYNPEITVEFVHDMDTGSLNDNSILVIGEVSGYHTISVNYKRAEKKLIISHTNNFNAGEKVTVYLLNSILTESGDIISGFSWTFRIPTKNTNLNFEDPKTYNAGGFYVKCIDMNRDHTIDIVTSSGIILLNDGQGDFNNSWLIDDIDYAYPVLVDDFNSDSLPDLFYSGFSGLTIAIGDGEGNFTKKNYPSWFDGFTSEDINCDGSPDIVGFRVFDDTLSCISIAYNNDGFLKDTIKVDVLNSWFRKLQCADIDNDGDIDIVAIGHKPITPNPEEGFEGLALLRNEGNGIFNKFELFKISEKYIINFPEYLYLSDFNNDSYNDIAVMGGTGGIVMLDLVHGTYEGDIIPFWGPEAVAPITGGDFDGNKWVDLSISGYTFPLEGGPIYCKVLGNEQSNFFTDIFYESQLPSGIISDVVAADINNDKSLDIIHCGTNLHITFSKDTTTSVNDIYNLISNFELKQNYPNPFNSQTTIEFSNHIQMDFHIVITNILGEEVRVFDYKQLPPGIHKIQWDGKDSYARILSAGVYLIRTYTKESAKVIKAILLK